MGLQIRLTQWRCCCEMKGVDQGRRVELWQRLSSHRGREIKIAKWETMISAFQLPFSSNIAQAAPCAVWRYLKTPSSEQGFMGTWNLRASSHGRRWEQGEENGSLGGFPRERASCSPNAEATQQPSVGSGLSGLFQQGIYPSSSSRRRVKPLMLFLAPTYHRA